MINEIHRITLNHQSTCTCIKIEILLLRCGHPMTIHLPVYLYMYGCKIKHLSDQL